MRKLRTIVYFIAGTLVGASGMYALSKDARLETLIPKKDAGATALSNDCNNVSTKEQVRDREVFFVNCGGFF